MWLCGNLICFTNIFDVSLLSLIRDKTDLTNNSTHVVIKIRHHRTKMLRDSDSLKTRLLFTKWPMIIVLHNVIVFTEIPFLLISRKENCTETILIKYETRHYTFFFDTVKCLLHFIIFQPWHTTAQNPRAKNSLN